CVLAASSRPRPPVAAFAQPEFASTARSASRRQRSRLSSTGAAGVPLAVNRAALTGSLESQITIPTSGFPLRLIPQATPAALKPAGNPAPGSSSRTCSGLGVQREPKNGCGGPVEARSPHTSLPALTGGLPSRGAQT